MDGFESLVALLMEHDGKWVSQGFKLDLTPLEKTRIGKPSMPRPEIDILAYEAAENRLLWVECKSFLFSRGVLASGVMGDDPEARNMYKMFNDERLRDVVFKALKREAVKRGMTAKNPRIQLCLVAGRFGSDRDRETLAQHFQKKNWRLHGPDWVRERIKKLGDGGYHNHMAVMMAKLLSEPD